MKYGQLGLLEGLRKRSWSRKAYAIPLNTMSYAKSRVVELSSISYATLKKATRATHLRPGESMSPVAMSRYLTFVYIAKHTLSYQAIAY